MDTTALGRNLESRSLTDLNGSKPSSTSIDGEHGLRTMIDSVRQALCLCNEEHGAACDRSRLHLLQPRGCNSSSLVLDTSFTVLDVEEMKLLEISSDNSFIALSYVWGRKKNDETFWIQFSGEGLAQINLDRLPRTLSDAITLCRLLRYQYIWIDQLCIDQTDPAALDSQIHQMHQIYASANATIIVACNECADEGALCQIQPDSTVNSSEWPDALNQSAWSKRAWTFQEMQLSRRLIVLTSYGIHFHCSKAGAKLPVWYLPSVSKVSPWSAYNNILTEYTSRQLSYKVDTLNGIAGMARTLARFTDDSFLAGIPSKQIVYGLLWQPTGSNTRQPRWPSWSWAGWTGQGQSMCPIFYPSRDQVQSNHDRDPYSQPQMWSSIGSVVFEVTNSGVRLEIKNETVTSDSPDRNLEHCNDSCKDKCPLLAKLSPADDRPFYDYGTLNFEATILKITIKPTRIISPSYPELFQCLLMEGNAWIGSMFLAEDVLPTTEITNAEFAVLTTVTPYLHKFKSAVFGRMLGLDGGIDVFDDCFLSEARDIHNRKFEGWKRGEYHSQLGWTRGRGRRHTGLNHHIDDPHYGMPFPPQLCIRHVLWIQRDTSLDLAYRKGVGVVAGWTGHFTREEVHLA